MASNMYTVEIQRNNITPRQFFTYCKNQIEKRTGEDIMSIWCESYEAWSGEDGVPEYDNYCKHDDWDDPVMEICKTKAFDWQLFLGKSYNFIMEFEFDTEKKGHGYLFLMECNR